jgi:carboxylesterase
MRIKVPEPFFFQAGERAVLLLHGFTGTSADVRMLGRFLEKKGYTSYAPHYRGHGVPPEQLIETGPKDWWEDVRKGYETLKEKGYEKIAVAGLSLGGVLGLKLAMNVPLLGVVTMCSPMTMRTTEIMFQGVLKYAKEYKKIEGKNGEQIQLELEAIRQKGMPSLPDLQKFVHDVRQDLDLIYAPILVIQSRNDEIINPESAHIIYENVESLDKKLIWFEESGHVVTLDREKDKLHQDVFQFLEKLDWE